MAKIYIITHEVSEDDWKTIGESKMYWSVDPSIDFFQVVEKIKGEDEGYEHVRRLVGITQGPDTVRHIQD